MVIYVPGTEETDPKKQNMSLQQLGGGLTTAAASIATNTSDIATANTNIATNTTAIATLNTSYPAAKVAGTTTNDNAVAGNIGEFVSATVALGSAVSLTSTTAANVASISLTAGDWDVFGNLSFNGTGTTTVSSLRGGISTTTAAVPSTPDMAFEGYPSTTLFAQDARSVAVPQKRISIASTTTVYLVAQATFATSTANAFGKIEARRAR